MLAPEPQRAEPRSSQKRSHWHRIRIRDRLSRGIRFMARIGRIIRPIAVPALWLGLLALSAGIVVGAYMWLASIPPLPDCKKLPPLAADADKLYCAERAARSGKEESLLAGFDLVKGWSANHPLHHRANRALKEWSKTALAIAQQKASKGNLEGAITLARKIPSNSPTQKEVKAAIAGWQKSQNQIPVLEQAFETALKQQNWQTAEDKTRALFRLKSDAVGQEQVNHLRQRLATEQRAWEQVETARALVQTDSQSVETLTTAIAQVNSLPPETYAQTNAKADLNQWGQSLLAIAADRMANSHLEGAIAAAQAVPFSVSPPPNLRDLLWFTRARTLTADKISDAPISEQLWQLWTVLLHLRQIPSSSPFFAKSQALSPYLQQQVQDLTQLQAATAAAELGQIPALQLAIQLAQTIKPDRPQRLLAQSLIARWQKEIQRVQDRPTLIAAQQLAAPGTLADLTRAIAEAKLITPGRPLWSEARRSIQQWTGQIQAIEDRPLLDRAKALAKQRKLKVAIQTANKIRSDRSLYKEAQASIKGWTEQIQISEDRPILSKAKSLADHGDLSAAVDVASQIGADRALYREAQSAIAAWSAQQEAASHRFNRFPSRYGRDDNGPPFGFRSRPSFGPFGRY